MVWDCPTTSGMVLVEDVDVRLDGYGLAWY